MADLEDILFNVATRSGSGRVALAYVARIRERCESLALAPLSGRSRSDLDEGLRVMPFEKRILIIYRFSEGAVQIVGIIHASRDVDALFGRTVRRKNLAADEEPM